MDDMNRRNRRSGHIVWQRYIAISKLSENLRHRQRMAMVMTSFMGWNSSVQSR